MILMMCKIKCTPATSTKETNKRRKNAMRNKICAGIVTYNPSMSDVKKSIQQLSQQVHSIIIVDNASDNISDIEKIIQKNSQITLIRNNQNKGIAAALNQIFVFAKNKGFHWVLTLDDDSEISDGYIEALYSKIDENVGIVCPILEDRKTGRKFESKTKKDTCITSGSLTSIEAWTAVGGFDEWLFIDAVDFDFSKRIYRAGWRIEKNNNAILLHSIGDTEIKNLLFWQPAVRNHSVFRKYYQERNYLYLDYKLNEYSYMKELLRFIKHCAIVILWENEKRTKIQAMLKGRKDGLKKIRSMKMGEQ